MLQNSLLGMLALHEVLSRKPESVIVVSRLCRRPSHFCFAAQGLVHSVGRSDDVPQCLRTRRALNPKPETLSPKP